LSLTTAINTLSDINQEIDGRYTMFEEAGVTCIDKYCTRMTQIPHHIVVIDELSEFAIGTREPRADVKRMKLAFHNELDRITRLGRAAGIHVIACTQRPDKDSLPGYIKANIPVTVAFRVRNRINSQIVTDGDFAAELPALPGRGILQHGLTQTEFQTIYLEEEEALNWLNKAKVIVEKTAPENVKQRRKGILTHEQLPEGI